jgi:hypothetical protein
MPSDLVSRAREIADTQRETREKVAADQARLEAQLQADLVSMKAAVIAELKKLEGEQTKWGPFSLDLSNLARDVFAYLQVGQRKVAWFKARIVSGTFDGSDDCRNIPYTEPQVWARFYPPDPSRNHDGSWDLEEISKNHNGGRTITHSDRYEGKMKRFFEEMAGQLSVWF